eukprot:g4914.t1
MTLPGNKCQMAFAQSIESSATIKIVVVPVGDVPSVLLREFVNSLPSFVSFRSLTTPRNFSLKTLQRLPWHTGSLHFDFVLASELSSRADSGSIWQSFQPHHRIMGVIGICHCPGWSDSTLEDINGGWRSRAAKYVPSAQDSFQALFCCNPSNEQLDRVGEFKPHGALLFCKRGKDEKESRLRPLVVTVNEAIRHMSVRFLREVDLWLQSLEDCNDTLVVPGLGLITLRTILDGTDRGGWLKNLQTVEGRNKKMRKLRRGRINKFKADICLLVGSPADAAPLYVTAFADCLREGDFLWTAGASEGLGICDVMAELQKNTLKEDESSNLRERNFSWNENVPSRFIAAAASYHKAGADTLAVQAHLKLARYYVSLYQSNHSNDVLNGGSFRLLAAKQLSLAWAIADKARRLLIKSTNVPAVNNGSPVIRSPSSASLTAPAAGTSDDGKRMEVKLSQMDVFSVALNCANESRNLAMFRRFSFFAHCAAGLEWRLAQEAQYRGSGDRSKHLARAYALERLAALQSGALPSNDRENKYGIGSSSLQCEILRSLMRLAYSLGESSLVITLGVRLLRLGAVNELMGTSVQRSLHVELRRAASKLRTSTVASRNDLKLPSSSSKRLTIDTKMSEKPAYINLGGESALPILLGLELRSIRLQETFAPEKSSSSETKSVLDYNPFSSVNEENIDVQSKRSCWGMKDVFEVAMRVYNPLSVSLNVDSAQLVSRRRNAIEAFPISFSMKPKTTMILILSAKAVEQGPLDIIGCRILALGLEVIHERTTLGDIGGSSSSLRASDLRAATLNPLQHGEPLPIEMKILPQLPYLVLRDRSELHRWKDQFERNIKLISSKTNHLNLFEGEEHSIMVLAENIGSAPVEHYKLSVVIDKVFHTTSRTSYEKKVMFDVFNWSCENGNSSEIENVRTGPIAWNCKSISKDKNPFICIVANLRADLDYKQIQLQCEYGNNSDKLRRSLVIDIIFHVKKPILFREISLIPETPDIPSMILCRGNEKEKENELITIDSDSKFCNLMVELFNNALKTDIKCEIIMENTDGPRSSRLGIIPCGGSTRLLLRTHRHHAPDHNSLKVKWSLFNNQNSGNDSRSGEISFPLLESKRRDIPIKVPVNLNQLQTPGMRIDILIERCDDSSTIYDSNAAGSEVLRLHFGFFFKFQVTILSMNECVKAKKLLSIILLRKGGNGEWVVLLPSSLIVAGKFSEIAIPTEKTFNHSAFINFSEPGRYAVAICVNSEEVLTWHKRLIEIDAVEVK